MTVKVAKLCFSGVMSRELTLEPGQNARYVERILRGGDYIKTDDGAYLRPQSVTHFYITRRRVPDEGE